jgi:hypothetical protein
MRFVACGSLVISTVVLLIQPAAAEIIGRAVSSDPDIFLEFNQLDPDYDIPGDMFGIRSRDFPNPPDCLLCPGVPFAMLDATNDLFDPFPTDRLGLVRSDDYLPFFGVVDTMNDTGEPLNTASWTFDIAGSANFRISMDMAAMGDFEAGNVDRPSRDAFAFDYSIDGGPFLTLFASTVDTEASQNYEMELPDPDQPVITYEDPLAMDGVVLNNLFRSV